MRSRIMHITRKQEGLLINLGIQKVLEQLETPVVKKPRAKKSRRWSKTQHAKFAKSMKKAWAKKRAEANK